MSEIAVRIVNIGKKYHLGELRRRKTFRETLVDTVSNPIRRTRGILRGHAYAAAGLNEEIWAVRDVSFDVFAGEAVGIIGHNGAGKSTLLKILSRITEPTEGYVDLYGRIGALLEVGTGFHNELTGRENVFLNGAILGMARQEIESKFDEILDFSGVEKFIDTPVKFYSSGMRLRLGFAVAAYLDPEILIIDEVLAVGDAAFQQKCLGKMQDVTQQGRTVLFVSHNMEAITTLTQRCFLMKSGQVISTGPSSQIVADYLRGLDTSESRDGHLDFTPSTNGGDRDVVFTWMQVRDPDGVGRSMYTEREPFNVMIGLTIFNRVHSLQVGLAVNRLGYRESLFTIPTPVMTEDIEPGDYQLHLSIDPNYLRSGDYLLQIKAFVDGMRQRYVNGLKLTILPKEGDPTSTLYLQHWVAGRFRFDYDFSPLERVDHSLAPVENGRE